MVPAPSALMQVEAHCIVLQTIGTRVMPVPQDVHVDGSCLQAVALVFDHALGCAKQPSSSSGPASPSLDASHIGRENAAVALLNDIVSWSSGKRSMASCRHLFKSAWRQASVLLHVLRTNGATIISGEATRMEGSDGGGGRWQ